MILFRVYQSGRTQSKLTLSQSFQCTSLKQNHQFSAEKNVDLNTSVDTKIVNLAFVEAKELYCGVLLPALCPKLHLQVN
jgi:hypothetical protein